jgi:cell fate (sporulation/competence/biofilm development) regulator YlbF (YheA/YmcA/DUF963 family)
MSTTEKITEQAAALGKLLSEHEVVKTLRSATKSFDNDQATQRAIMDFNRLLQTIAHKEQAGQPIEVEDKRKLRSAQDAVIMNPLLRTYQKAQMDYADLLRKVDEAMLAPLGLNQEAAKNPPGSSAMFGGVAGAGGAGPVLMS